MALENEKAPGGGSYVRRRDGSLECVQRTLPAGAEEAEPAPAVVEQTEDNGNEES